MTTSLDIKGVLLDFPFPKFRKYQKKILEEITEAFNSDYRWILLETPPGFGKSPINVAFGKAMTSFYLTPQNFLLSQLQNDFHNLALIKGRRHYQCAEISGNCDEEAPCKKNGKYLCQDKYTRCPYWIDKINAIASQTALTNFAYFVLEGFIPQFSNIPHLGNRELIIVDEGHDIDSHILNYVNLTLSSRTLPYSVFQDIKTLLLELPKRIPQYQIESLLEKTSFACQDYLEELPSEKSGEQVTNEKRAGDFLRRLELYQKNLAADWVGQIDQRSYSRGSWVRAKIQPVFVQNFMFEHLWKRGERFIISSATLFRHNFVKECGLSQYKDEICYTFTPSSFPVKNRRIVDASKGRSLSWNKKQETLPIALNTIRKILAMETEKGIIHAHSYGFAETIQKTIHDPRLMFHTSDNREEKLKSFLNSPIETGCVLVAVAMTEGLDLFDDRCRFQIMFKCPFSNYVGDLRTRRRLKELHHNRWYAVKTLKQIVQAYGRAVRSPTDKAVFYILDNDINRVCQRWRSQLPRFFRQAYDARRKLV